MEEKKERSYDKEKFKTEPSGIRFNLKQLPIALSKSNKRTKQQLVDFLIDRFVNGENPVLERQPNYAVGIDVYRNEKETIPIAAQVYAKNWQYYMNLIPSIKDIEGCQRLDTEIRANKNLLPNEVKRLIENLVIHSKTLLND